MSEILNSCQRRKQIIIFTCRCLPYEAVKYCISACFFAILWGQLQVMDADSGSRGEDECRQLKERLHSFMGSMRHFVTVTSDDSTDNTNTVIIKSKNYTLHMINLE